MKVILLCGGKGTRLSEETANRPKPMVTIGGKPILWHLINHYLHYDIEEFVLALGYKSHVIKEYFINYNAMNSDLTVDLNSGRVEVRRQHRSLGKVHLVDTGEETLTGGRLNRLSDIVRDGTFMLTYGDGVSNVNLRELLAFHKAHGKLATVTAVRPTARFGALQMEGNRVDSFREKVQSSEGWINGGFFVFEPGVLDYLQDGDETVLEGAPMEKLAAAGQLQAYRHNGFWQCMDNIRDRTYLEELWASGEPPWKSWPG